ESAVQIDWPEASPELANRKARAIHADFLARPMTGLVETIPAAASILIRHEALGFDREAAIARAHLAESRFAAIDAPRAIEVPVVYGGEHGVDLEETAAACGLSPAQYAARHQESSFTVAFVGFLPGFPYLSGLPEELAAGRRAAPRVRVPPGSVAVAGRFCG